MRKMRTPWLLFAALICFNPITATLTARALAADAAPVAAAPAPAASQPATPAAAAPEAKTPGKAVEAPTAGTQKWWQGVLVIVIKAVVAIVTPILSILLMFLVRKWGLKLEQEKVDWILDKSLGAGEQKLKTLLKDGKPVEGPVIVKAALDTGGPLLEKYGLAKKFGTWLADGIEARLGEKVIESGGAAKVVSGSKPPAEG